MARYTGSVCRFCRREGQKLFLKGHRCYTEKCGFERRAYPPGQHGQRRTKVTDYGVQLREKQKVRRSYGLLEKQFKQTFVRATRMRGVAGENLLALLELRLDSVVYRSGFGLSLSHARQLVNHGHVAVNGRKVDIPSYTVRSGDRIEIRDRSKKNDSIQSALAAGREIPEWLSVDRDGLSSSVTRLPAREDIKMPFNEQLIVELYSK